MPSGRSSRVRDDVGAVRTWIIGAERSSGPMRAEGHWRYLPVAAHRDPGGRARRPCKHTTTVPNVSELLVFATGLADERYTACDRPYVLSRG